MGVAVPRAPGVRNPLKSSVTGHSLLVNCYLEIKFHKKSLDLCRGDCCSDHCRVVFCNITPFKGGGGGGYQPIYLESFDFELTVG